MENLYHSFTHGDSGLPQDLRQRFALAGIPLSFVKHEFIYLQGESARQFYYIISGRVKTFLSSEEGDERTLTVYKAGDILGEASFFDGMPRMSSAVALTACRLSAIDRPLLLDLFREDPQLAMALLKDLARTVRMLSSHVNSISFLPAGQRIARLLLSICRNQEGSVQYTHDEIGTAVGVSRVTVSRVLNGFSQKGWISTGYGSVQVKDRAALLAFAERPEG